MQPPLTRLLRVAQAAGATIQPGEHMIRAQVSLLLDFILGARG